VKIKILLALFFIGVSFFFIGTQPVNAAGSCTCTSDSNRSYFVNSNSCSSNSVATCKVSGTSIGNFNLSCDCIESKSESNCIKEGVLPPNISLCCAGSYLYSPTRTCFKNGTDPFSLPIPTTPNSPTDNGSSITCEKNGINTAIGCIPVLGSTNEFLSSLLKWAVGVGSGIAFLLMLYAGFMVMTASGNPERLKAGQELLTSAIAGLILLIFSVFILRFIGVDILGLDAFGFGK